MSEPGQLTPPDPPMASVKENGATRFGFLAFFGAAASVAACFAKILITLLAPLFGLAIIGVNPHVQAIIMWGFAALAVIGLVRDRKRHDSKLPLQIGVGALILIIGTLYTYYDDRILILGYVLLVAAAFINQTAMLGNYNRTIQAQARELKAMNESLEERVQSQVDEIEQLARLKRFLSPEVANLVTTREGESLLDSHRRYIACLFCDIRDFTSLSESIEPEEVMNVLQGYHEQLGRLVQKYHATIGYRAGDGLMVFFNDPLPCDNPVLEAMKLAHEMLEVFNRSREQWRKLGYEFGFGIGVASGYATLGLIGVEGRTDYTAIGNVVNIAARLCDRAKDGEVLINLRANAEIGNEVESEAVGALDLKGIAKPVEVFRINRFTATG
jgi:class 3 adenylate cyclase